jgi:hypothetical protein
VVGGGSSSQQQRLWRYFYSALRGCKWFFGKLLWLFIIVNSNNDDDDDDDYDVALGPHQWYTPRYWRPTRFGSVNHIYLLVSWDSKRPFEKTQSSGQRPPIVTCQWPGVRISSVQNANEIEQLIMNPLIFYLVRSHLACLRLCSFRNNFFFFRKVDYWIIHPGHTFHPFRACA